MATTPTPTPELSPAARLAVIELLINPEYGQDWLDEMLTSQGEEATPAAREELDTTVILQLRALAAPFIAQLPAELREVYAPRS